MTLAGLRIAFVAGTLGQGGAERQLFYMVRVLREQGANPVVLSLSRGEHWEERIAALGVPVQWVGRRHSRAGRLFDIVSAVRRQRPHAVQSSHFYTNPYAALGALAYRVPAIGAIRSDAVSDVRSVDRWLAGPCLRWPNVLFVNSRAGIENARGMGISAERLKLLPNAIDTSAFSFQSPTPGQAFRVAAIGRLSAQKRIDRLIRVMAAVRCRTQRPVRLTIAGIGPLRGTLEDLVRELQLTEVVRFIGPIADVRPLLAGADCLALSSDSEGTPNVVLEAMAVGRVVVATDVGGVRDLIVDSSTGYIVPPQDEAAFAQRLAQLASDPELCDRLGRQASQTVERTHSLTHLPSTLERLYNAALGAARPTP